MTCCQYNSYMKRYKKIFDFGYAIDNPNYDTLYNVRVMNIMFISVLSIFALINYFFKNQYTLAFIELFIALILVLSTFIHYRYKNLKVYIFVTTFTLLISTLFVHFYIEMTYFSNLFIIFFPLVAFMINGLRLGLYVTILYDIIIITSTYFRELNGFEHLIIALIALSVLSYYFERSRRVAFEKLQNAVKKLDKLSKIDELTELHNRHFLNNNLLENETLYNKPMMFCIVDIDNFKAYNDYYGHPMGDDVIKKIANIKNNTICSVSDNYVVRLGGEEFGAYIFDVKNAKKYIESFMKALNEAMIEHEKNQPYNICTVSIGAVYCNSFTPSQYSKVYSMADEALYQAKKNGKNRVVYKEVA